jgi:hypothetical protein
VKLRPLPDDFGTTRDLLHQIAFFVLGPARYQAEGRMGLQAAPGGFGTPMFDGKVARVEGDVLVVEEAEKIATQTITTVRAAAEFVGLTYEVDWFDGEFHDPLPPMDPDAPLDVDDTAARALGQWFNFGFDVLEELRGHGVSGDEVTPVQLWPEHFDPATEMGSQDLGRRASYGASPGDGGHPTPYVYVSAWGEIDQSNPYWNAPSFRGSLLGYRDLVSAGDPTRTALDFLLTGHRILHSP